MRNWNVVGLRELPEGARQYGHRGQLYMLAELKGMAE